VFSLNPQTEPESESASEPESESASESDSKARFFETFGDFAFLRVGVIESNFLGFTGFTVALTIAHRYPPVFVSTLLYQFPSPPFLRRPAKSVGSKAGDFRLERLDGFDGFDGWRAQGALAQGASADFGVFDDFDEFDEFDDFRVFDAFGVFDAFDGISHERIFSLLKM